jgi:uncharacterized SAM-binding protein YcdF (DUF218 family)
VSATTRRSLAAFSEIAVVLGGGLRGDGTPTGSTQRRADAAARLAAERDVALIVSGSHGNGPQPKVSEAEYMARRLAELGVAEERVFIEDESRDTLSNAVCVAERYLARIAPRRLTIVTSPFHMARSLATFAFVLGPEWPIDAYPAAPGEQDDAHAATEELYLGNLRARLEGLQPGDLRRIAERARSSLPLHVSDDPPRS